MMVSGNALSIRENSDAGIAASAGILHSVDGRVCRPAEVIVNADDWGRDCATTCRILDCHRAGTISSVSAMVFMTDSERAADIARQMGVDAGLHLNFTAPFSAKHVPPRLAEHQQEIARTLSRNKLAPALYHPRLTASFEYVANVQIEEYLRIYGSGPGRLDGHHHMHLCANVMCQNLLPAGSIVRRNLSFRPGEKHVVNRLYRQIQDRKLAHRHRLADYFFDLHPTAPSDRLQRIFALGAHFNVEIETHPIRDEEYRVLMNGELRRYAGETRVASNYILHAHQPIHARESQA